MNTVQNGYELWQVEEGRITDIPFDSIELGVDWAIKQIKNEIYIVPTSVESRYLIRTTNIRLWMERYNVTEEVAETFYNMNLRNKFRLAPIVLEIMGNEYCLQAVLGYNGVNQRKWMSQWAEVMDDVFDGLNAQVRIDVIATVQRLVRKLAAADSPAEKDAVEA